MKKILAISCSPRTGGNSDILMDEFIRGAKSSGNVVEKISLAGKQINFCKGCWGCLKTGQCVIDDDAESIVAKMRMADVIVFATPIYYYQMCGQMKTLLDRTNVMYGKKYSFREIYILSTAEASGDYVFENAINGLKGWIRVFHEAELKGMVCAGKVAEKGAIKGNNVLKKAYKMGQNIS